MFVIISDINAQEASVDLIIIGGGPAGLSFARSLAQCDLDVVHATDVLRHEWHRSAVYQ